jgi:hypothetical protein
MLNAIRSLGQNMRRVKLMMMCWPNGQTDKWPYDKKAASADAVFGFLIRI